MVQSIDYTTKRIYLDSSTVDADVDTIEIYKEVRALRRLNEDHRKFKPIIIGGGNVTKIPGVNATPIYAQLLYGCRLVPYSTGDHKVKLVRDTFTDDGKAGRDCFDRTGLTNMVDIDVDFPEVEIRYLDSGGGGGLTAAEVWQYSARTLTERIGIERNVALPNFTFLMTDNVEHTPSTGLSVSASRSIDGAAFAACANAVSEIGSGVYRINLAAADLNGKVITLRFTATNSDDRVITIITEP